MDMGGYVIVINAEKVQVTGRKFTDKLYRRHTNGRPGSMKEETFDKLQKVWGAGWVWGMVWKRGRWGWVDASCVMRGVVQRANRITGLWVVVQK